MKKYYRLYSSLPQSERHLTCAEIDLGALAHNFRTLKAALPSEGTPRLIAVVKADAYGHGAPACVRALLEEGCDFFAVSCIDEAVTVRATCKEARREAEILILGYTPPALAAELARFDLTQTLLSYEYATLLDAAARAARVRIRTHAAIDTGMNRIGLAAYDEASIARSAEELLAVSRMEHLTLAGMFTHPARADEETDGGVEFTALQAARYRALRARIEEAGLFIPFHHACNSAATLTSPALRMDGVRPGLLLYGVSPLKNASLPLRPVLRLRTAVMHLHTLAPGEGLGYGSTFRATEERLIATLPIGYADGLLRAYSGASVTVESKDGRFCAPIVGRICMDQCMIDVTGHAPAVGDAVTVFGSSPSELSAYAAHAGTIPYECLCLISSRVPRQYVQNSTTEALDE